MSSKVLCLILGGGRGARLWPLTKSRAKPAVPVGGKYRLIDIPLSNCLNSGLNHISVLTQFNSVSLHRHIARTYQFDLFHAGWVQILAAEQTSTISDWYQGTADAVRKHLSEIVATEATEVLILAGDHLYRMDFAEVLDYHRSREADITVAVKAVSRSDAQRFGVLRRASNGQITAFTEKPQSEAVLQDFASGQDAERPYLGSMGIYVFNTPVLVELLDSDFFDFGSHLIPAAIPSHRVFGFGFDGYWEDIGTIRTFYEANLAFAQSDPPFSFHDPVRPVYTHPRFLPGCRIYDVHLDRVMLADGCIIEHAAVRNSVIGNRSVIGEDVTIEDSVIMGADYYEEEPSRAPPGAPPIGIGRGSSIQGAIIDKNARIGPGTKIRSFPHAVNRDEDNWSVRDGVVVVAKNAIIAPNTIIEPS